MTHDSRIILPADNDYMRDYVPTAYQGVSIQVEQTKWELHIIICTIH